MLTPERWQQIKLIVEQALDYPPAQRQHFIETSCQGDQLMLKEVEAMLANCDDADNFLEVPAHKLLNSNSQDSGNIATLHRHTDELITRPNLQPGVKFLGKYELLRIIGRGGMGQVYQARHIDLKTMVAIKLLHNDLTLDDGAIERFKREAYTAAKLEHPNIVRVVDYGVVNKNGYLVMEYLSGESLRERISKCRSMPLSAVLQFAEQVCQALTIVHQKGIIHRDLKPENIFFHQHNGQEIVKLLDFGIAKINSLLSNAPSLTNPGDIFGTPHYMSPEQCQARPLDARADIYSLGVILYELLSGRKPIEADNPLSLMYAHVHNQPTNLAELAPDISFNIAQVVMKAMAKNPVDRYQSAQELWQALSTTLEDTTSIETNITSANSLIPTMAIGNTQETLIIKTNKKQSIESSSVLPIKMGLTPIQKAIIRPLAITAIFILLWYSIGSLGLQKYIFVPSTTNKYKGELPKIYPSQSRLKIPLEKFAEMTGGTVSIGSLGNECAGVPDCQENIDEGPVHEVKLTPYYIGKYEVTNREYQEFIDATDYAAPKDWQKRKYPEGKDDLPITNISWFDANQYCQWLTKREGVVYRLPTEAEWEHAARGDNYNRFPWGYIWINDFTNVGKKSLNAGPLPINVAPNNSDDLSNFGVFALAGNVSEWTSSDFKPYPDSKYQPKDLDLACKVYRGGSFNTYADSARTTFRAWSLPDKTFKDVGFRLAVTAE